MATLYITEFSARPLDSESLMTPVVIQPPVAEQTVAIGGSSAQSSAFASTTKIVRVHTDAKCSVLFGTNPTATTSKMRMAADSTEYFVVPQNQSWKVAVIAGA